jgi:Pentapeptide repeats (8 copies)
MLKSWADLPRGSRWLAGGIAAVLLALVVVWVLFVPAADWLAHHDVGSAGGSLHETALDNARGRLLTLGAGLFAAGALIFTARNFTVSRRTLELTEQGQVTDRYTKAIEQLGSEKLDVRIGGIYALERIARDSARDHPTVMEVLTAFIREHSHEQWPPSGQGQSTRPDIQAVLTVVGRRDPHPDIRPIELASAALADADLAEANLAGADLAYGDFSRANFYGANLAGADLRQSDLSRANFDGAILVGAILDRADLADAYVAAADLASARLDGAVWPRDTAVPEGWQQDTGSGRLKLAGTDSGPMEADGRQNGGSSE